MTRPERIYSLRVRKVVFEQSTIAFLTCAFLGGLLSGALEGVFRYLVAAGTVVISLIAAHRAFRLTLDVLDDTVVIRNYWRTQRFPVADVEAIGIGALTMGILPQPAIGFLLRDGREVLAQSTPRSTDEQNQELARLSELFAASVQIRWAKPRRTLLKAFRRL